MGFSLLLCSVYYPNIDTKPQPEPFLKLVVGTAEGGYSHKALLG
jgi:hypothetical protein